MAEDDPGHVGLESFPFPQKVPYKRKREAKEFAKK